MERTRGCRLGNTGSRPSSRTPCVPWHAGRPRRFCSGALVRRERAPVGIYHSSGIVLLVYHSYYSFAQVREYREGELLVFDDSYEHEVSTLLLYYAIIHYTPIYFTMLYDLVSGRVMSYFRSSMVVVQRPAGLWPLRTRTNTRSI